jgi:flagellar biosynthesis/type III secretory pathway M-ring protein FliF/YscJ
MEKLKNIKEWFVSLNKKSQIAVVAGSVIVVIIIVGLF